MPRPGTSRARRRAMARRRGLIILVILLCAILLTLVICAAFVSKLPDGTTEQQQSVSTTKEPATLLELPEGVQLLTPDLPATATAKAEVFVSGLEGTGISVSFAVEPAAEVGEQSATLLFSKGTAVCTREVSCYRFAMKQSVVVDVSENRISDVRDFVTDSKVTVSLQENLTLDSIGTKKLTLICGENAFDVQYIVKESNPPAGMPCDTSAEIGTLPDPATLVTEIKDESDVTVSYKNAPVLTTVGDYTVTLILTDAYGNTAELNAIIHVLPAKNAPQFTGLEDMKISVGDAVSYKKGVEAMDPQDGSVSFTVDASALDRNQEGTYIVYYSATDSDGNTTIVPRKIIVQSLNKTAVEQLAESILASIITPDMSRDQQILAVYQYTKDNVKYVGTSNKESIWHSAYEGLTTGKGDCYTYYAINRIMLDMLGIENLEVRRIGGTSNHWWNLVLHEDGIYYHVDSCPVAVKVEEVFHGKMTDSDLVVYTTNETVANRRPNFYVYDKTLPEYQDINIAQ